MNILYKLNRVPWQIKLVSLMLFMALIPGLLISYSITGLIRDELKSNINDKLVFSSNSIASSIDSKVKKTLETLDLVKNVFENPKLDSDQKVAFLVSSLEKIDNILSITIAVKTKGGYEEALSTKKDFLKKKNNQLVPLADALQKINLDEIEYNGSELFILNTPEYNGKLRTWIATLTSKCKIPQLGDAIIIVQLDFSEISDALENHYLNKAGAVFLSDISGKKFLSFPLLTKVQEKISQEGLSLLKTKNRITLINNYSFSSDQKYVACFAYTTNVDWVVVAYIDEAIAYATVNNAFIFFTIYIVISGLLSIIASILFSRHLSKPIVKMAAASRDIASGNFDVRFEYDSKDSIGELSESLNSMEGQLKQNFSEIEQQRNMLEDYSKNLEKKVELRTNELSISNQELKKAYQRVLELNEEKNEFMGIAAHDLKNPLMAISSFAEILKEDKDLSVEQHDDFLGEIEKASKRMFLIIKNLLDVNVIEQGKLMTKMEKVSLIVVGQELKTQFSEILLNKNIVIVESYDSENLEILSDYNLTIQIVQNILSNAIKFSSPNKKIFMGSRLAPNPDYIELRIKDEGPGFTENDKKKLFQKFAKLSARPTAGEDSTGLGLSIVKKLVEMLGGNIKLESEAGNGAEFIITFQKAGSNAVAN